MDLAVIKWCAIFASGASLSLLAVVFLKSLSDGATSYADAYSGEASHELEDLFLFIPPKRIAEIGTILAATAFLLFAGLFFNPDNLMMVCVGIVVGAVAALGAFQLPRLIIARLKAKRRERFNEQLVEALNQISNALKAGFSITQAFETVVTNGENPIAQEFDVFLRQTRVGISFSDALSNLTERIGSEDMELVAQAMEISRKTGGNLTEVFDKISLTIRERMRIERRVLTLTAQGRMQGWIVGLMPVVVGLAMICFRPEVMLPYLHSPAGLASIAAVLVLLTLGGLVIRKIVTIDV